MDVEDEDVPDPGNVAAPRQVAVGKTPRPRQLGEEGLHKTGTRVSWVGLGRSSSDASSCMRSSISDNWVPHLQPLFVDGDAMKQKVRERLLKGPYTVASFYKEVGLPQKVARSAWFEHLTLFVIGQHVLPLLAALVSSNPRTMGRYHRAKASTLSGSRMRRTTTMHRCCIRFSFDSFLVLLMVADTGIVTLVVALSTSDESGSGMAASLRSVFFTLCLLFIVLYVFAIALTQLSLDHPISAEMYFGSVLDSMYSLLLHGAFADNLSIVANHVGQESWLVVSLFIVCVLLGAYTIMNLLIGVLCNVVSAVAKAEREQIAVALVKEKMQGIVKKIDTDGNKMISKLEFQEIVENHDAVKALEEVNVDVCGLVDLAELIFEDDDDMRRMVGSGGDSGMHHENSDGKEISFENFMSMVLELRNTNTATVKDIMTLRRYNRQCFLRLSAQLDIHNKLLASTAHYLKHSQPRRASRTDKRRNSCDSAASTPNRRADRRMRRGVTASPPSKHTSASTFAPPDSPPESPKDECNTCQPTESVDMIGTWSPITTKEDFRKLSMDELPQVVLEQGQSWTPLRGGSVRVPGFWAGAVPGSTIVEEHRERMEHSLRRGLNELERLSQKLAVHGPGLTRGPPAYLPGVPDEAEPVYRRERQQLRMAAAAGPPAELADQVQRLGDILHFGLREAVAMKRKQTGIVRSGGTTIT